MKKVLCLILLCLVSWTEAATLQESCGRAGALACDPDGSHVATCTRSGTWQKVRDCAPTHEVCAGGRCVTGNATRAASCSAPGRNDCSSDCEYVTFCSTNGVWVVVGKCPEGTLCVDGECKSSSQYHCGSTIPVVCGDSTAGQTFPNLEDCSSYFSCDKEWSDPKVNYCTSGYYDPCSETCSLVSPLPCRHNKPCTPENDGLDASIFGNPALHYTCASNTMVLKKCDVGVYDPIDGECWGDGLVCRKC